MIETAIADHGLIGDLQTAALVTTDGSIDWFCCPRFDSPSVFGALLDDERGGHFRVRPVGEEYTSQQMYHPDTAILITRFMTASGVCEVHDFMPVSGSEVTGNHRLVRMLRCVRGRVSMEFDVFPQFDFGRARHDDRWSAWTRTHTGLSLRESQHARALTTFAEVTTDPVPAIERMMPVFSPPWTSSLNRDTSNRL